MEPMLINVPIASYSPQSMDSKICLVPASCSGIPKSTPSPMEPWTHTFTRFPSSAKVSATTRISSISVPILYTSMSGFNSGMFISTFSLFFPSCIALVVAPRTSS
eukprot:Gb_29522 [translate_table: standard]